MKCKKITKKYFITILFSFTETELESSIINNLQKFLMKLRKRICFCCKTTTYSNRKRRLLYRFGILQLYIKMFCVD